LWFAAGAVVIEWNVGCRLRHADIRAGMAKAGRSYVTAAAPTRRGAVIRWLRTIRHRNTPTVQPRSISMPQTYSLRLRPHLITLRLPLTQIRKVSPVQHAMAPEAALTADCQIAYSNALGTSHILTTP
jgi:hypothetical protein